MGTGRVKVWMFTNGKWAKSVLQDDLYVLDLHGNLLLVSHLAWCGAEVYFLSENCHMYNKCKSLILKGRLRNDLYVMRMQIDSPIIAKLAILDTHLKDTSQPPSYALTSCLTSSSALLDIRHCRLGHFHTCAITCMVDDNLVTSIDVSNYDSPASPCEPCLEDKQT